MELLTGCTTRLAKAAQPDGGDRTSSRGQSCGAERPGKARSTRGDRHLDRRLVFWWFTTRMVILEVGVSFPVLFSDFHYYAQNAHEHSLTSGLQEYPFPIAVALMAPARVMSLEAYIGVILGAVIVVDAAVTLMLARVHRDIATRWIIFVSFLGPACYLRFDMFVAAAIAAVLINAKRRPIISGIAAACGSAIKLWPALLGVGLTSPADRRIRHTISAGLGGVAWVGLTCLFAGWHRLLTPLTWQRGRGLEFESPLACVVGLMRAFGVSDVHLVFRYGSWEYAGSLADRLHAPVVVVEFLGYGVVAIIVGVGYLRSRRRREPPLALTATAVATTLIVTSPVLSPQYLMWLGAPIAYLAYKRLRMIAFTAALLTQIELPFTVVPLLGSERGMAVPCVVIVVRDILLIALALGAIVRFFRYSVPVEPARPGVEAWRSSRTLAQADEPAI